MKWKAIDFSFIFVLIALAIFIWVRDLTWMSAPDDTLPILVAIPLFFWLGMPWTFRDEPPSISLYKIALAVFLLLAGIILNLTILLALGWTLLLWTWLSSRTLPSQHKSIFRLLILPLMAFPWITLDAQTIGWWFRLSGAWVTARFFSFLHYSVYEEGTNLLINGLPISVEAACAGLNTLQSMLIAGTAVAFIMLGKTKFYWLNIMLLIGMAWLANTIRIIFLVIIALVYGPEIAMGSFHMWGGWFILCVMFGLCWFIFRLQEPKIDNYKDA
jgi:exosortase/archaeosortase family protein